MEYYIFIHNSRFDSNYPDFAKVDGFADSPKKINCNLFTLYAFYYKRQTPFPFLFFGPYGIEPKGGEEKFTVTKRNGRRFTRCSPDGSIIRVLKAAGIHG